MKFRGKYFFLSNFYPSPVWYDGMEYPTVEHAYQAAKTFSFAEMRAIAKARTPGEAKRMGKRLNPESLRPEWEKVKVEVMRHLLFAKFERHPDLAKLLLETEDLHLCEDNNWGDRFWGRVDGYGMNALGELLMDVRTVLQGRKSKKK